MPLDTCPHTLLFGCELGPFSPDIIFSQMAKPRQGREWGRLEVVVVTDASKWEEERERGKKPKQNPNEGKGKENRIGMGMEKENKEENL